MPVLSDIYCTVPRNSIAGIIGPNGAGKSTLLKIIAGIEDADSGNIAIDDYQSDSGGNRLSLLAYMPERLGLYPQYTVAEIVTFFESTTRRRDEHLFKQLRLHSVYTTKIINLSKGFYQRVKLYLALNNDKPYILLDEPFDGFDPIQLRELQAILHAVQSEGRTIILTIHHLYLAERICDYIILLHNGTLFAAGTKQELKEKYTADNLEEIFIKAL